MFDFYPKNSGDLKSDQELYSDHGDLDRIKVRYSDPPVVVFLRFLKRGGYHISQCSASKTPHFCLYC